MSHKQKEDTLHSETAAIEKLPHVCRGHYTILTQMIRQHTTEWHYRGHYQMWQRPHKAGFFDFKMELMLQERGLEKYE